MPTKYFPQVADYLKESWEGFVEMRKSIKAPLTPFAAILTLRRLAELDQTQEGQVAILNQSIQRSWRGVFPVVPDKSDFVSASEDKPF